jgi:hypothetical protein
MWDVNLKILSVLGDSAKNGKRTRRQRLKILSVIGYSV